MSLALHWPFYQNASLTDLASGVALACTRATERSMPDADGWIREVQDNEAAFEGATFRHNKWLQSQDFSSASWSKTNATVSADATTDPDGGTAADKFVEDSDVASVHSVSQTVAGGVKSGHVYTFSIYAKAAERSEIYISISAAGFPNNTAKYFNIGTGSLGSNGSNPPDDATITDVGGGWYRCSLTITSDEDSGTANAVIVMSSGSETITYNGDGTSGIYLYGAQIEDVSGRWDSENLLLQSNTLDNASWQNVTSVDSTGYSDPDGGTDAWRLIDNNDASLGSAFIRQLLTLPEPGRYTLSFYAKSDQEDWCRPYINQLSGRTQSANFNLAAGSLGTDGADTIDSTIASAGNGWYRCSMTFEATSDDLGCWVELYIGEADNDVTFASRDGTHSILLYKTQLERTKPAQVGPGTYTATTTAAVTNYSPGNYIATTTVAKSVLSGANDGLVDWEARTNILLQSEDLSTSWVNTLTIDSQGVTVAPDGSLTGNKLIDDNGGGTGSLYVYQSLTFSTSTAYTLSFFAKADQLSWIRFAIASLGTLAITAFYDLANGAVGATVGADVDATGIEDYGNGWYRCWLRFTSDATDTTGQFRINLANGDNDITVARDNTSSVFLWGAQVEVGSKPSPYIRTTTGTVTANSDNVTGTLSGEIGTGPVSFYVRFKKQDTFDGNRYLYYLDDGSTTDRYHSFVDSGQDCNFFTESSLGANVGLQPNITIALDTEAEAAAGFDENNCVQYVDGGAAGSTASCALLGDAPTRISLGISTSGLIPLNGLIQEFRGYNTWDGEATTIEGMSNGVFPSFSRRVKLLRDLTANLTRGLIRNLIN